MIRPCVRQVVGMRRFRRRCWVFLAGLLIASLLAPGFWGAAGPAAAQGDDDCLPNHGELEEFFLALDMAVAFSDDRNLDALWAEIVACDRMPLIFDDVVVFLYRGQAESVKWRGLFAGWPSPEGQGENVGGRNVWLYAARYPLDARIDYKLAIDDGEDILDPLNPRVQLGWIEPDGRRVETSVVQMPEYVPSPYVTPRDDVAHGNLSEDITLTSIKLGYDVNYRVYTPPGYDDLDGLPVVYLTDGHQYAHPELGAMPIVLDNLIAEGLIPPVMAVFVDPRRPVTLENRRERELAGSYSYAAFLVEELVPAIDAAYRTDARPEARALMGMSLGGLNATFMALVEPDVFGMFGIQSPFLIPAPWLVSAHADSDPLPIRVFLSTGFFDLDVENARALRTVFTAQGYDLLYMQTNETHNWGNWSRQLDDALIFFFAPDSQPDNE